MWRDLRAHGDEGVQGTKIKESVMVVKSKRGRQRYIVFDVSGDMTKELLIKRFRSASPQSQPYIVLCTAGKAVIRCHQKQKEETIRLLSQVDPFSASLMTSGTLLKIRRTYPELKDTKNKLH
jgi:hypothetical protein